MAIGTTHQYDDILGFSRPVSSHPHMPRPERAKIFSPFAALRGHGDAVLAMQKNRCSKIALEDIALEQINTALCALRKHDKIEVTYFNYDPGPDGTGGIAEGRYLTAQGEILMLDTVYRKLRISSDQSAVGWVDIKFEDIFSL
ncbi:MAG: hypothetical protein PHR92_13920 [Lachnospiraceae bacterium]|nr:hypothetical protein [Lachnospiraceae bacterium]